VLRALPPRLRTPALFPYTTLCRSGVRRGGAQPALREFLQDGRAVRRERTRGVVERAVGPGEHDRIEARVAREPVEGSERRLTAGEHRDAPRERLVAVPSRGERAERMQA